jgi:septum formation protein
MSFMPLVLASSSPRRQHLLTEAGIEFVVRPANIQEIRLPSEAPKEFAERMAKEKAAFIRNYGINQNEAVLGADTVVVIENEVLGKPADANDAARMLRLLSGRKHFVITGVCLAGRNFEDVRSETTGVYFSELSEGEIASYVESGEPMDKAGAYAIQCGASRWVAKIEGDYNNVVGLPVDLVKRMLRQHGV